MSTYSNNNEDMDFPDASSGDAFYANTRMGSAGFARPLINFVRNEWQNKAHLIHGTSSSSTNMTGSRRWMQTIFSLIAAPRVKRYLIALTVLLVAVWVGWKFVLSPRLEENATLHRALDPQLKDRTGGWFGTNALPKFDKLIQLKTLDPSLLPGDVATSENDANRRRLIFVGDVHGCRNELEQLLDKANFNPKHDHLIMAGDMINKGPDSPGVVDLARKYSASCVRGNHEDKVLTLRHEMEASNTLADASEGDSRERRLARQLTAEQVKWLDSCPVILQVGQVHGMGEVVVVHGGLVPGVELQKQDPYSVMNMLTIDLDTHVPSAKREGTNWTKLFNKYQSELYSSLKKTTTNAKSKTTTVIYGHDSKRSLSIAPYTIGLDTACVKGEKLTAMVVEDGGKQTIVQVKCNNPKGWKQ